MVSWVECKENIKGVWGKKNNYLNYVKFFYYKVNVITNGNIFKGYVLTTNISETNLMFGIHYFRNTMKGKWFVKFYLLYKFYDE